MLRGFAARMDAPAPEFSAGVAGARSFAVEPRREPLKEPGAL
jgi:hypothetical protein